MLLEIAQWLAKEVRVFNVFNYITLRAVLACLTALAVSLILGPYMIRKLTAYKIGQAVREEGPRSHLTKAGTPTMGGALILVSICLTTLLWGDLSNRLLWVVLLVTLAFGTIGWIDDYRKVVQHDPKGLSAKAKFFWQSVIGLSAAAYLAYLAQGVPALNELIVPFFKLVAYPLGPIGFIVLTYFVIVGTSNAVNLTDRLDGLAIMRSVRGRDPVCDDPGAVLQVDRRKADFPHGASPSPLRAGGVEGEPGRSALLDHHHDAGPVRTLDPEAPMMREPLFNLLPRPAPVALTGRRVLVLGLGDTGLSVARWIEHQGGKVRVADTRESPPRRGDFAGELHTGPFRAACGLGA